MKIAMPCPLCLKGPTNEELRNAPRLSGDLLDGGIVRAHCPAGHAVTWTLQDPPFDLMFELAALALVDGYYREAIVGAHTAIERFFEFYVGVALHEHGVADDEYETFWNGVQRQSERQLGAFLATYLAEEGRPFDMRRYDEQIPMRNRVTHKGYIPTRDEAADYLKWVLGVIHGVLMDRYPPETRNFNQRAGRSYPKALYWVGRHLHARAKEERVNILAKPSLVNFSQPDTWGKVDFEAHLTELAGDRSVFQRGQ